MRLGKIVSLMVVMAVMAVAVIAGNDPVTGKYEGVAKSASLGDIPLSVQLKNDGGKLSGTIETPQGPADITGGSFADGKLKMTFDAGGMIGTLTAMLKDGGLIVGEWELGGETGTLELKRVGAPAAPAGETAAGDPVSGEWDASADVQGTSLPFVMKLKFEGGNVTGTTESAQGELPISKGTYSGDKLSITLDTPNGPIVLTGIIKDGKLTGEFDFAGQMTGKWEAKKK